MYIIIRSKGAHQVCFERPFLYQKALQVYWPGYASGDWYTRLQREGIVANERYGRAHGGNQPADGQIWG